MAVGDILEPADGDERKVGTIAFSQLLGAAASSGGFVPHVELSEEEPHLLAAHRTSELLVCQEIEPTLATLRDNGGRMPW